MQVKTKSAVWEVISFCIPAARYVWKVCTKKSCMIFCYYCFLEIWKKIPDRKTGIQLDIQKYVVISVRQYIWCFRGKNCFQKMKMMHFFSLMWMMGLRWMACEKIVIFFNFIKIAKHTYSYAKFIVNSISENRFLPILSQTWDICIF